MRLTQLSEAEIEERFHVTGAQAVAFLLAGFVKDEVRFSVHFGEEMFLTTLLAVQPDKLQLVFDCGGSNEVNRRLLRSPRNIFVGRPGGIHVQFTVGEVTEMMFAGSKAFVVTLPPHVVRLQRREYFRVETPRVRPLEFFGRLPEGGLLKLPVHDISVAGMALTAAGSLPPLEVGMRLEHCHCSLPEDDREFFFCATVRHLTEQEARNGSQHWRIGLQFDALPVGEEVRIQRYIVRLERERHELV